MSNRAVLCCFAFAGALPSFATVTTRVDLLDDGDEGGPPPTGIVVADVYADLAPGSGAWTACGVNGDTLHGALMRYALTPAGNPNLRNPGLNNRFVTLVSRPYGRNDGGRFTQSGASIAGGYLEESPLARTYGHRRREPDQTAARTPSYSAQGLCL